MEKVFTLRADPRQWRLWLAHMVEPPVVEAGAGAGSVIHFRTWVGGVSEPFRAHVLECAFIQGVGHWTVDISSDCIDIRESWTFSPTDGDTLVDWRLEHHVKGGFLAHLAEWFLLEAALTDFMDDCLRNMRRVCETERMR